MYLIASVVFVSGFKLSNYTTLLKIILPSLSISAPTLKDIQHPPIMGKSKQKIKQKASKKSKHGKKNASGHKESGTYPSLLVSIYADNFTDLPSLIMIMIMMMERRKQAKLGGGSFV